MKPNSQYCFFVSFPPPQISPHTSTSPFLSFLFPPKHYKNLPPIFFSLAKSGEAVCCHTNSTTKHHESCKETHLLYIPYNSTAWFIGIPINGSKQKTPQIINQYHFLLKTPLKKAVPLLIHTPNKQPICSCFQTILVFVFAMFFSHKNLCFFPCFFSKKESSLAFGPALSIQVVGCDDTIAITIEGAEGIAPTLFRKARIS